MRKIEEAMCAAVKERRDWRCDNDLDGDWFYNNFEDEEELFWALDEKWFDPKNYSE